MQRTILIVDDEPLVRRSRRTLLQRQQNWRVLEAASCAEARKVLEIGMPIDAILLDITLPDGTGWGLLESSPRSLDRPAVIVITGDGTLDHAIAAIRRGASDLLLKPFVSQELFDALAKCFQKTTSGASSMRRAKPINRWRGEHASEIVASHPALVDMLELVRRVSATDASVLITGESGTGKELIARALHRGSARSASPLITLNCAAIPENLVESELFGHAKGAFTGATQARPGLFVAADRGTMFLDEIGELALPMQSKLLRVLQEQEVTPLGEQRPIPIDARIIAATNVDFERSVREGLFREDLYYRLNVVRIEVPPLPERISDVAELAESFVAHWSRRLKCRITGIAPAALERLQSHAWPGNVRELENCIQRMVVLRQEGQLDVSDLPPALGTRTDGVLQATVPKLPDSGIDLRTAVDEYERSLIEQALERSNGNKSRAARLMRSNRTTLIHKIKKLTPSHLDEAEEEEVDDLGRYGSAARRAEKFVAPPGPRRAPRRGRLTGGAPARRSRVDSSPDGAGATGLADRLDLGEGFEVPGAAHLGVRPRGTPESAPADRPLRLGGVLRRQDLPQDPPPPATLPGSGSMHADCRSLIGFRHVQTNVQITGRQRQRLIARPNDETSVGRGPHRSPPMQPPASRTAVRDEESKWPDGAVDGDGATVRVLLVEDDYDSFRLVERRLSLSERAEFQVEWAASLPEGLSEVDKAPYDAIVLDLALPGSEGMATIAGISAIARQIPIVVLTGSDNAALAMKAADCGIQDYLVKEQQDAQSLITAVLSAIERQRAGASPPSSSPA